MVVVEEGACCYSPFCCHDPDELQQQSHMYLLLKEWLENISVSVCEGMFMNDPPAPPPPPPPHPCNKDGLSFSLLLLLAALPSESFRG